MLSSSRVTWMDKPTSVQSEKTGGVVKTAQHGVSVQSTQCTSSKMRFLALMIAALRAFTHNSFSSGLTARNTRFGTCKDTGGHKGLMDVDWNRVTNPKPVNLLTLWLFIPKIKGLPPSLVFLT